MLKNDKHLKNYASVFINIKNEDLQHCCIHIVDNPTIWSINELRNQACVSGVSGVTKTNKERERERDLRVQRIDDSHVMKNLQKQLATQTLIIPKSY